MRDRYVVAGRAARSALLDEAVAMTGYHRKALIRRFTRPLGPRRASPGAPPSVWADGGGGVASAVAGGGVSLVGAAEGVAAGVVAAGPCAICT